MQAYYFFFRKKHLMKLSNYTNEKNIFHTHFSFNIHHCMNIPSLYMQWERSSYTLMSIKDTLLLNISQCFGSRWRYRVENETALQGSSHARFFLYYRLCFWRQNYAFANVSLKMHVFLTNVS